MKWIKCSERLPNTEGLDDSFYVKCDNGFDEWKASAFWMDNEWADWHSANGSSGNTSEIIEWLDESDHSDEEAAFNAAREGGIRRIPVVIDQYGSVNIEEHFVADKYPTFTDYLKSKQEQESNR